MKEEKLVWWSGLNLNTYMFIYIYTVMLICSNNLASASIHYYENQPFIPQSDAFFFHGGSEGLYASNNNKPHNGDSFIRFETVSFQRTAESADKQNSMQSRTGVIEAIVFEVKDRERIGGGFLNISSICCTPQLSQDGSCTVGEVIIHTQSDNPEWPRRIQTFFEGTKQEAKMGTVSVEINSTGMYYLYFMFCDPELKGTVISGRTVWKNPHGYLPGKMAPLMTFYGIASLAYLVLGLVWFLRFVKFWKDIIQLHYHITVVIALGMCETALWYFEYANLNATRIRTAISVVKPYLNETAVIGLEALQDLEELASMEIVSVQLGVQGAPVDVESAPVNVQSANVLSAPVDLNVFLRWNFAAT